jgi:hypothetical protein
MCQKGYKTMACSSAACFRALQALLEVGDTKPGLFLSMVKAAATRDVSNMPYSFRANDATTVLVPLILVLLELEIRCPQDSLNKA